jgi:hypothetical protein
VQLLFPLTRIQNSKSDLVVRVAPPHTHTFESGRMDEMSNVSEFVKTTSLTTNQNPSFLYFDDTPHVPPLPPDIFCAGKNFEGSDALKDLVQGLML